MDLLLQLRHFVVLGEELSFGRAARRIGIAQPPLSQGIRRLEAHLGTELVDRSRRQIALTAAGSALLVEARSLLTVIDQLPARLSPPAPRARTLSFGIPQTTSTVALAGLAQAVDIVHPVVLPPHERSVGLEDGRLDVALLPASTSAPDAACFDHALGLVGVSAPVHPVDVTLPVLISPEEHGIEGAPTPIDQLHRRGLAPHLLRDVQDPLIAAVEVRAERALWLTTAEQAARFDLGWHALVGRPLVQRYEIRWHAVGDEAHFGDDLSHALRSAWPPLPNAPMRADAPGWGLYPR